MLLSIGTVNAFAAEPTLSDSRIDAAIQAYCSSDDFTLEGLQAKFPEFYAACQREYAQDALMIQSIQNNLGAMLAAGQQIAATDIKCNEAVYCDSTLGTYGDILVSLAVDSGSFGFAGHAAIVSDSRYETIESYAKSFSPIDKDGVQIMITIGALRRDRYSFVLTVQPIPITAVLLILLKLKSAYRTTGTS